jgi:hypothetical protein
LEHGTGSPDEQPVGVNVGVERHLEVLGLQTTRRRPVPGGTDLVADLGRETVAGEERGQGAPQIELSEVRITARAGARNTTDIRPKEGYWQDHIRSGGHVIPFRQS